MVVVDSQIDDVERAGRGTGLSDQQCDHGVIMLGDAGDAFVDAADDLLGGEIAFIAQAVGIDELLAEGALFQAQDLFNPSPACSRWR